MDRISTDPDVCHGRPCIGGHRIWVSLIVDLLADGMTTEQILEQYPELERNTIYVVLSDKTAEKNGDLRVIDESGEMTCFPPIASSPSRFPQR